MPHLGGTDSLKEQGPTKTLEFNQCKIIYLICGKTTISHGKSPAGLSLVCTRETTRFLIMNLAVISHCRISKNQCAHVDVNIILVDNTVALMAG